MVQRSDRTWGRCFLCLSWLCCALAVSGCGSPSLLITPVSGRRELVERELSRESLLSWDKIALIDVSGLLMNSAKTQWLAKGEHPVSLLLEQLDKARRDPSVKAVVLRINSPGGTVVASELMHAEIMHFKKSGKPVIAVMMDVAASGGYYIACACDEIVAQASSITGSIGVVMQMIDVSGTMKMIGVTSDAIVSGEHKDTGSPFRPMRPDERRIFQDIVNEMFERFIDVVDAGRPGLNKAQVRRLADGRVYTASQALEAGLIDRIATMRETLQIAKERAGLKKMRVVTYHRPANYRPNYYASTPQRMQSDINLIHLDVGSLLDRTAPRFMYLWSPSIR